MGYHGIQRCLGADFAPISVTAACNATNEGRVVRPMQPLAPVLRTMQAGDWALAGGGSVIVFLLRPTNIVIA